MSFANLNVRIGADIREFQQVADRMKKALEPVRKQLKDVGENLTKFVTLPIAAVGAASLKAASDVEEMRGKFNVVFGNLAGDVEEWAKTHADAVNRSVFDLQGYASQLQDTFVPMGFAREQAAQLSKQMVELGVDLASFNNEAENETLNNLTSTLIGNHEAARRWGVVITQATLNARLMAMGIAGGTQAATEQEKILARIAILTESTSDAQGDAARTAGSFANQMRGLQGAVQRAGAEIGELLLPGATRLVQIGRALLNSFSGLSDGMQGFIVTAGGIAAAIGPIALGLGSILRIIPIIKAGFAVLAGSLGPFGIAAAAIAAAGILIFKNWDRIREAFQGPISRASERLQGVFESLKAVARDVMASISQAVSALMPVFESVVESIRVLWDRFGGFLTGVLVNQFNQILDIVTTSAQLFGDVFGALVDLVTGDWSGLWERIKSITRTFTGFVVRTVARMVDNILGMVETLFGWIPGVNSAIGAARSFINDIRKDFERPIVAGAIVPPEDPGAPDRPTIPAGSSVSASPVDPEALKRAEEIRKVLAALPGEIARAAAEAQVFNNPLAAVEGRADAIKKAIVDLLEQGLNPSDERVQNLAAQFQAATTEAQNLASNIAISDIMADAGSEIARVRAEALALGESINVPQQEVEILEATIRELVAASDGFNDTSALVAAFTAELQRAKKAAEEMKMQLAVDDALDNFNQSMTVAAARLQLFGDQGEFARSKVEAIRTQINDLIVAGVDPLSDRMQNLFAELQAAEKLAEIEAQFASFGERIRSITEDFVGGIGEAFGKAIAGTQRLGQGLKEAIGNAAGNALIALGKLAIRVGFIAIGLGKAVGAIKAALASLNPFVAIAAGAALIALGTAVKASLSSAAGGSSGGAGSGGFGSSGVGFGNTSSVVNANTAPAGREAVEREINVNVNLRSRNTAAGDIAYSAEEGERRLQRQGSDRF